MFLSIVKLVLYSCIGSTLFKIIGMNIEIADVYTLLVPFWIMQMFLDIDFKIF